MRQKGVVVSNLKRCYNFAATRPARGASRRFPGGDPPAMKQRYWFPWLASLVLACLTVSVSAAPVYHGSRGGRYVPPPTPATAPAHVEHGDVPIGWTLPFVLLLASIALMPFVARHFWERHSAKVPVGLALLVACYYPLYRQALGPWLAEMKEYVSF